MKGLEPISARNLYDHLVEHGCRFDHQVGAHLSGRAPTGATIRIPDPGSNHPVTTVLVRELGLTFGKNLHDTRVWLGYGKTGKARITDKRAATAKKRQDVKHDPIDFVDASAERIQKAATAIYRSGPARQANLDKRRELQSIANRIEQWFHGVA